MADETGHGASAGQRSDEELMLAYQKGDTSAFDMLYRRYKVPLSVALAHRVGRNRGIVEELYDDAFCRVIEGKDTFDPSKGCFRAWLFTIAFNNHHGLFRSTEIFLRSVAVSLSEKLPTALVEKISVQELLKDLPARQRRVMELIVSGEFTLRQVAVIMGTSVQAVYKLHHDAVKRLRKQHRIEPAAATVPLHPQA